MLQRVVVSEIIVVQYCIQSCNVVQLYETQVYYTEIKPNTFTLIDVDVDGQYECSDNSIVS